MSLLGNLFRKRPDVHERKCLDDIRDYGCHVMQIYADGDDPQFSYSVGFPVSVGQPEVIVFGLKQEIMHSMINEIHAQCVAGLVLADGVRVGNLIEGFDCVLRHVTNKGAITQHFGWAIWYHRSQRGLKFSEAYQIVWPGAVDGLFPWNTGCTQRVIEMQPTLYDARTIN